MGKDWDSFPKGNRGVCRKTGNGNPCESHGFAKDVHWQYGQSARNQFIDFLTPRLAECLRVAKPGARMLCWAIPRTSHWTGIAVEDAGWIVESKIYHLFGSGFPKAKSQLKPAAEEWILARKPGGKVPALQIDACRVGTAADLTSSNRAGHSGKESPVHVFGPKRMHAEPSGLGRWPANVCLSHSEGCRRVGVKRVKGSNGWVGWRGGPGNTLAGSVDGTLNVGPDANTHADPDGRETVEAWECVDGCPVKELDEQAGDRGRLGPDHISRTALGLMNDDGWQPRPVASEGYGDSGGPSRFFATFGYFSKASRTDRGEGNTHPTVKNTDLMKWLCRLICPPGGTILDPFMGSGSTGKAAVVEGFDFIGIEANPEYFAIAERRIAAARDAQPLFANASP